MDTPLTSPSAPDRLIFGAAYYDEYLLPTVGDRLADDVALMKKAGFTTVRIAESTWGTMEPQPGVFDFTHVDRALDAFQEAGIGVIIGTPTYAIPTWMAARHPDVIAITPAGQGKYGTRQNMDITSPTYRFYAERAIRALLEHTAERTVVVGFQLDNETKYYETAGPAVQRAFITSLREQFHDDLAAMNAAFGLNYWSNRINSWEDFPDVTGTINGSFAAAFDKFRRGLVTEFLAWQRSIVDEYRRPDQFVTHNFDYEWRGYSFGLQPAVDHFAAAETVTLAGTDIYHPTEDHLTGKEIAFGGDVNRSIKDGAGYLVLETQAQGQMGWLPFPGQLRLQAYSHLASGAMGIMYWHWHSIHNSFETYWKGLLSQDFSENPTYLEAADFGNEIAAHAPSLTGLTKHNKAAIMVSNEALTALEWFGIESGFPRAFFPSIAYNDVLRWAYDALFDLNIEVDIVPPTADAQKLAQYAMVVVPALYSAPDSTTTTLREYVQQGGHLVTTFRTGVADENVQVWADRQPHGLSNILGMGTDQFTRPEGVKITLSGSLSSSHVPTSELEVSTYMELLTPVEGEGAGLEVLASYDHHAWEGPAIVRRTTTGGSITHVGAMVSPAVLRGVFLEVASAAGVSDWAQPLAGKVTVRRGINAAGAAVTYLLNYSAKEVSIAVPISGVDVLGTAGEPGAPLTEGSDLRIPAWGVLVLESEASAS